jgi:SAM-dependent methyltransferase
MDDMPDLTRLFDAFTAYQRTAAIRAAVELDVFTHIGSAGATLAELAERTGAAARGLRSLCNRLVVDGLLAKDGDRYTLRPDAAAFLDRGAPTYVGSAVAFLTSAMVMGAYGMLTEAVRRGGTAVGDDGSLAPEHPMWVEFARAMAPFAGLTARLLVNALAPLGAIRGSVLDVAAGHGLFGITLAQEHPEARVVALDWPDVLAVAEENATARGVRDRFSARPGSAFEVDLGRDHALVLLANFLHHFDPKTNADLLRRVHAALAPGGHVVAVEFVPDESRVAPPEAAAFSLTMLATTPHGDAYTHREYTEMFRAAGFGELSLADLAPSPQRALIAPKA